MILKYLSAHRLAGLLLASLVRKIDGEGNLISFDADRPEGTVCILVLNRLHYFDFIRSIANENTFFCLNIPWEVLGQLRLSFVADPRPAEVRMAAIPVPGNRHVFLHAQPGTRIYRDRERYRKFLEKTLPYLFDKLSVDCVLNSDARFCREVDVARVSTQLGVPHFCVTRESMFLTAGLRDRVIKRHRYLGKFPGAKLLAQNGATKEVLVESGYVQPEKVSVIGSVRSIALIKAIEDDKHKFCYEKKSVVMFTWPPKCYGPDGYRLELSGATRAAVRSMCRVAIEQPEIIFYIKPKHNHASRELLEPIEAEIRSFGANVCNNVVLLDKNIDSLSLILSASVVIAMQSTTVLEAAVAEKPVLLPHFSSLRADERYVEAMLYADDHSLFDVPEDEFELTEMIRARLRDPAIDPEILKQRRKLFEQHVCPMDGGVMGRFVSEIRQML